MANKKQWVIRRVGPGEWSVQEKAVPGFKLSHSTMEARRTPGKTQKNSS